MIAVRSMVLFLIVTVLSGCAGALEQGPVGANRAVLELTGQTLEDHGCGHGFTTGTADGTVRLSLWAGDGTAAPSEPPMPGTVDLSGGDWTGELVMGRDLFAQWCDDAVEPGEPEVVEEARWPVVSGTLVWEATGTGQCDGPATARLTDAAVQVDDGTLPLPDLELHNDFFGCFAG